MFEPVDGGTRFEVDSAFHLRGFMRLIGLAFVKNYEPGWDRSLAKLKGMLEAGEL